MQMSRAAAVQKYVQGQGSGRTAPNYSAVCVEKSKTTIRSR